MGVWVAAVAPCVGGQGLRIGGARLFHGRFGGKKHLLRGPRGPRDGRAPAPVRPVFGRPGAKVPGSSRAPSGRRNGADSPNQPGNDPRFETTIVHPRFRGSFFQRHGTSTRGGQPGQERGGHLMGAERSYRTRKRDRVAVLDQAQGAGPGTWPQKGDRGLSGPTHYPERPQGAAVQARAIAKERTRPTTAEIRTGGRIFFPPSAITQKEGIRPTFISNAGLRERACPKKAI